MPIEAQPPTVELPCQQDGWKPVSHQVQGVKEPARHLVVRHDSEVDVDREAVGPQDGGPCGVHGNARLGDADGVGGVGGDVVGGVVAVVRAGVVVVGLQGNPHQVGRAHKEVHDGEVHQDSPGSRADAGNHQVREDDEERADHGEGAGHAHHSCQGFPQVVQAGKPRSGHGRQGSS